jgi:hypothetical protein
LDLLKAKTMASTMMARKMATMKEQLTSVPRWVKVRAQW